MLIKSPAITLSLAVLLGAAVSLVPSPLRAGPAMLFEPSTGKVLYAEEADQHWHPASLTKIMTAYLAFEAIEKGELKLDGKIIASEVSQKEPPSKIGLPVGAEISVDLALKALIIKSANDVAVMLAEAIDGSVEKFAARMNATAKRLGMQRTHFNNPNGLPDKQQVTTARDLSLLSAAVIKDFPQFASLWSMNDMMVGKRRLRTHNALLRTYDGADGLKTGFICDSGFNVVGSATRNGRRLMVVVLGEMSGRERAVRAASLLEHGFATYEWKELLKPSTARLADMPMGATLGPVSLREVVVSWECGRKPKVAKRNKGRKSQQVRRRGKGKAAAAATSKSKAGKTKPAAKTGRRKTKSEASAKPAASAAPTKSAAIRP